MTNISALSGPLGGPASGGTPQSAVIFLHGYGADGNDLFSLAGYFAELLPDSVFLAPNAPEPCEMGGPGKQWFSLATYDPNMLRRDPNEHTEVWQTMKAGADAAAPVLHQFIDEVLAAFSLPAEKLALVGFSQGTMMALHVGLRRPEPLAGIMGFSGALLGASTLKDEMKSPCPISLVHGSADPVVRVQAVHPRVRNLTGLGVDQRAQEIPGLQHGMDQKGADAARIFLAKCFEDDAS